MTIITLSLFSKHYNLWSECQVCLEAFFERREKLEFFENLFRRGMHLLLHVAAIDLFLSGGLWLLLLKTQDQAAMAA